MNFNTQTPDENETGIPGLYVIYDEDHGFYMTDDEGGYLRFYTIDDAKEAIEEWFAENPTERSFTVVQRKTHERVFHKEVRGWFGCDDRTVA